MTTPFSQRVVDAGGRSFQVTLLKFENGSFVSITEGSPKLGAMVVSLSTEPTPVTTTVIPSKTDSFFLRLAAERIGAIGRGISIVSSSVQGELKADIAKALMGEITEMVRDA